MVQNKNKLIELFIWNIANTIVHRILEKAIEKVEIAQRYRKELITSLEIAKRYRQKINPVNSPLSEKDISYIKEKIIRRVKSELLNRISKGYENINLDSVEEHLNDVLKETKVI